MIALKTKTGKYWIGIGAKIDDSPWQAYQWPLAEQKQALNAAAAVNELHGLELILCII